MIYCRKFCPMMLIVFLGIAFIGCGADEEAAFEISDKAPTVSIEKVGHEINEYGYINTVYKVVSDTAPKNDLLVNVTVSGAMWRGSSGVEDPCKGFSFKRWVTIPKGKKESQEIEPRDYNLVAINSNSYIRAEVEPLPIVSIVGEGEVIDQQTLQERYGGEETVDGRRIPESFVFPYYEADSKVVYLYQPNKAKIINIDPPPGSFVNSNDTIKITFDTPPQCPTIHWIHHPWPKTVGGDGTEFSISVRWANIARGRFKPISLKVTWVRVGEGDEDSQRFEYKQVGN